MLNIPTKYPIYLALNGGMMKMLDENPNRYVLVCSRIATIVMETVRMAIIEIDS